MTAVRHWKIACQEQLLPGASLAEKWEFAQSAGLDGIELRGQGDGAFEARLPSLRQAAGHGVVMPAVCVDMLHFIGDFDRDRREDAIRQLSAQVRVIAAVGGRVAMTPASYGLFSRRLPPLREPPRSPAEDRAVLLDGLHRLAELAAREGVLICLEPLNRYEDYLVNTLAQAAELCRAVGLPSVRVAADTYHMNIEQADPARALMAAGPWLGHVQLSDSNRLEPGAGHLDWTSTFAALDTVGYDGWTSLECRLSGPAKSALPAAVSLLRQAGGG
ncbi:MAG: sugar phosphate isomerase/epimerase [Pseudonocardiaceae bacterium]|nr:sugar phosphate isomerase/epimerase [Pseudonocardiaceae bacterium]